MWVPTSVSRSCSSGVNAPGRSANSSSRGEKTAPAPWADPVIPFQVHALGAVRPQVAVLPAARLEGDLTLGTVRAGFRRAVREVRGVTGGSHVRDHAGREPRQHLLRG